MFISLFHRQKIFLALCFCLLIHFSNAQQLDIEALKRQLEHVRSSSDSIIVLSLLCKAYFPLEKKEAADYGKQALSIATHLKLQNQNIAIINYLTATALRFSNQPVEAIQFLNESLRMFEGLDDKKWIAKAKQELSITHFYLGKYVEALSYGDSALEEFRSQKNDSGQIEILTHLGYIYQAQSNYGKALDCYNNSLKLAEQMRSNGYRADNFYALAGFYKMKGEYASAKDYFNKALSLSDTSDHVFMAKQKSFLATLESNLGEYDEASRHLTEAINVLTINSDYQGLRYAYQNMNDLLKTIKKPREAIPYALLSLNAFQKTDDVEGAAEQMANIGETYWQLHNFDSSKYFLTTALNIADSMHYLFVQEICCNVLSKLYREENKNDEAYDALSRLIVIRDSVSTIEKRNELLKLKTQFESDQKDKENQLLKATNAQVAIKLQRNRAWLIAAIVAVILLIVLYRSYQLRQQARLLKVRNKIAQDLHDDIGASLSSIRMYSESVRSQTKEKLPQADFILEKISDNSKELVDNMSDIVWAINPKNDSLQNMEERMRSFAMEICSAKNISAEFNFDNGGLKLPMDIRKNIFLIYKEAVNNAVKYSRCNNIHVELKKENHSLHLQVADDGVGFDSKEIKRGNGLHNMQQRAEEIKASIKIDGASGKGTNIAVNVHLP